MGRTFWIPFLGFALCVALALVAYHRVEVATARSTLTNRQRGRVDVAIRALEERFEHVGADVLFFSHQPAVAELFDTASDPARLRREWAVFAETHPSYDQLRILDANGREFLRFNYVDGQAVWVPKDQLQNKSHRSYFKQTMLLSPGEIYVSRLDLNMEHGKIEVPAKPVVRFCTPLFDSHGVQAGVVVLNYRGASVFHELASEHEPRLTTPFGWSTTRGSGFTVWQMSSNTLASCAPRGHSGP